MNKTIVIALMSYSLIGCASLTNTEDDSFNHAVDGANLPSGMFTYYDKPSSIFMPVDYTRVGKFIIENNCLLLQTEYGSFTPVFPAKYTRYQQGNSKIIFYDESIKIGKTIKIPAILMDRRAIGVQRVGEEPRYITKGQPQCLTERVMKIVNSK